MLRGRRNPTARGEHVQLDALDPGDISKVAVLMRRIIASMVFFGVSCCSVSAGDGYVLFNGRMDPAVVRHWYTPSNVLKAVIDPTTRYNGMPSLGLIGNGGDPWSSVMLFMADGKSVDLGAYKAIEFMLRVRGEISLQLCLKGSNGGEKNLASNYLLIKKYLKDGRYPAEGEWASACVPLADFTPREGQDPVTSLESISIQHRDRPSGEFWLADIRLTDGTPRSSAVNTEIKRSDAGVTVNDVRVQLIEENVQK